MFCVLDAFFWRHFLLHGFLATIQSGAVQVWLWASPCYRRETPLGTDSAGGWAFCSAEAWDHLKAGNWICGCPGWRIVCRVAKLENRLLAVHPQSRFFQEVRVVLQVLFPTYAFIMVQAGTASYWIHDLLQIFASLQIWLVHVFIEIIAFYKVQISASFNQCFTLGNLPARFGPLFFVVVEFTSQVRWRGYLLT